MKYTIQHGVERQFSERVNRNLHYLLPLLVILAGVTFFLLNLQNSGRKAPDPLTLGIYTINSPDENKDTTNNGNPASDNGAGGTPLPNPITTSEANNLAAGNTGFVAAALPVGGRGGGDIQGSSSPTTTTEITTTPVPTTVSCVEKLTQTTLICVFPYQYCTPLLQSTTGVKTIDGTCIVIN